ncbi:MAG: MMPL family transporter [Oscillospiraceae bacterium]
MKHILKARWAILCVWVALTVILVAIQPDVNKIISERGQSPIEAGSPSLLASDLLKKMDTVTGKSSIIVFYDGDGIDEGELASVKEATARVTADKDNLGIGNIMDPFTSEAAKSSLVSADGTTVMVTFKLDRAGREMDDIIADFDEQLTGVDTEYYLTGEEFIANDYLKASVTGVERSAVLTVIFILVVLIVMFRSFITPVVSLLAVAFSYLVSMGITAQLIDKAGFPVTTLTQVLLVLILFGIGTDYNILLFNRFKEELAAGKDIDDAIISTYKTAGKTIIFSILTVLIAFLSLIFSKSPIYQSGVCVVIGAAVLILEILTLTPFAMKTLGAKFFWPSNSRGGHKESRLWGAITTFSTKRYLVSLALVGLVVGGAVYGYQQKLNFDQISELGNSHNSTKGFNIVSDHFGKGRAMMSTVVISGDTALDNNDDLAVIDKLTDDIRATDGVANVTGVTQPQGKKIDEFYINGQMASLGDGLTKIQDGVTQISDGFTDAEKQMNSADFSKVGELTDGTTKLSDAVSQLSDGVEKLKNGLDDGKATSETVVNGIAAIETNLTKMSAGLDTLSTSYVTMQAGFKEMGTHYQDTAQALLGIKTALTNLQPLVNALGTSYPALASDVNYLTLKGTLDTLVTNLSGVSAQGITTLNSNYNKAVAGFKTANDNLAKMADGLTQMATGLETLKTGVSTAADGASTIVTNMDKVTDGLDDLAAGQKKLSDGLSSFSTFGDQLTQVTDALGDISNGIGQSKDFLAQFENDKTFHIPDEALTSADFKAALDAYLSADRTTTKLYVELTDDPYSLAAADTVERINTVLSNDLEGSVLASAQYGVAGPSSTTNDMNTTMNSDLNKMIVIVLAGVFLVLLFVIRSFWIPVFITLGLVGSYMASIFVSNTLYIHILGYPGLSSFVPFFSFLAVVALGVDYSIFLMMRYRENRHMTAKEAIILAARQVGGVVMSAVIILGGTFATLIPSGMMILVELAVTVIAGLLILCFIILPVFLPAAISLSDKMSSFNERLSDNKK